VFRTTMTKSEKQLAHLPVFSGCSRRELGRIDHLTTEIEVPAGKVLCRQGSYSQEFFIVLWGEVTVDQDGEEIAVLEPGEFFGEIGLLATRFRTATVSSATTMRLLVAQRPEFLSLLETSPSISEKVKGVAFRRIAAHGDGGRRPPACGPTTVPIRPLAWDSTGPRVPRATTTITAP
jgi:CRP/FNR family transcriptional regulator, cyclic AMP receptor protein